MEHTSENPGSLESLRHHFSRRASAARIAARKLRHEQPVAVPPPETARIVTMPPYSGAVSGR